jgi:DNA primase
MPETYYRSQGLNLAGGGVWRTAPCPFHSDRTPSLRVNMARGGFCCMACGAKGGDVLDFHRKRHKMNFRNAAQALGAWRNTK